MIQRRQIRFLLCWFCAISGPASAVSAQPNIVLVFMDNFGWGELGTYGGGVLRGAPTPNIDSIADDGVKLLNFNVEAQCTPSRAALMTGRYAIRSGNGQVPWGTGIYGLTQWEYTMAEMLSDVGYTTAIYGKWHLGDSPGRYPTDQGFDEWYGIPNSSDESYWPDNDLFRENVHPQAKLAYVLQSKRGERPRKVALYDSEKRRLIDREITDRAKQFIRTHAKREKPFFLFLPYTQTHLPVAPHPDFAGITKNGNYADVLAQTDHYVGELLEAVQQSGIAEDSIFIFTADNGAEGVPPHQGFSGPWRGSYFTGLEGSLRVPFLMRWPAAVKPGVVTNDIVHEMDLYATFAAFTGGEVPIDRHMDSVDQSGFLLGQEPASARDSLVVYVGNEIFGVKWRNWKMMLKEVDLIAGTPIEQYGVPMFYDLLQDPKEEYPVQQAAENLWVRFPAGQVLVDHQRSLQAEPPIPPGTADPYLRGTAR